MRLSTHSTLPVGSEEADQGRGEQPGAARVLVAPVDHLDRRPTGPVAGAVRREQVAPRQRLQGGAGARQDAGHPGPARSLDGDVAGVPRRAPAPAGGPRRARRAPRRRPGRPPAPRPRPGCRRPSRRLRRAPNRWGAAATATPARRRRVLTVAASAAVGHRTRALPSDAAAVATCTRLVAGGRRSTDRGPANARVEQLVVRGRRRHGPAGARGAGRRTRSGEAVRRSDAGRPAHRQAAHRARSMSSAGGPEAAALGEGPQLDARGRLDVRSRRSSRRPAGRGARCGPRPRRAPGPGGRPGPGSRRSCRSPARPAGRGRRAASAGSRRLRHGNGRRRLASPRRREALAEGGVERSEARSKHQLRPRADLRSSTRVVCSQVRSLSSRPKCP